MDESARLKDDFQVQAEFEARWGRKREWGGDEDGDIPDLQQEEDARREKVLRDGVEDCPLWE